MSDEAIKPDKAIKAPPRDDLEQGPPLLGTWTRFYAAVLLSQATLIALFYAVTRVFS